MTAAHTLCNPAKHLRIHSQTLFFLGLLLAASGVVSPPIALLGGILFGFTVEHPLRREAASLARTLLQLSVVALGFGMNLIQVLAAGHSGFLYTALGIAFAIALGLFLGRLLAIPGQASFLITAGTAVCGGSAIAAIAPISQASEEEISISMGTVFLLNSIALFLFPAIGHLVHLDQTQFGLWAALAIHDTSSVVGAAAHYGPQALTIGTTVKLARALWIIPVSLLTAAFVRNRAARRNDGQFAADTPVPSVHPPWFILFFALASCAATGLPHLAPMWSILSRLGRTGLTATLFLIGTGLSRASLRAVGVRPLLQGVILWIIVATFSLTAILHRWIAL